MYIGNKFTEARTKETQVSWTSGKSAWNAWHKHCNKWNNKNTELHLELFVTAGLHLAWKLGLDNSEKPYWIQIKTLNLINVYLPKCFNEQSCFWCSSRFTPCSVRWRLFKCFFAFAFPFISKNFIVLLIIKFKHCKAIIWFFVCRIQFSLAALGVVLNFCSCCCRPNVLYSKPPSDIF